MKKLRNKYKMMKISMKLHKKLILKNNNKKVKRLEKIKAWGKYLKSL
jgi:hypothetical protein